MKMKLKSILLIDDNEADNFLHKLVIRDAACAEQVVAVNGGQEALEYLSETEEGLHPLSELIFLDINMPGMNGWEFLEEYKKMDISRTEQIVAVMLTTSPNPDDEEKARQIPEISKFVNKPLSKAILDEIITEYFGERL
ncbi:response regulator [uncultured Sunxiuqinia sp.]|uniref:response regulator n=1 Tax=uncultured Sunxiuqinia sp. TaxID=1573825 RepID=UPI0030D93CCA|tara:strand:- start:12461 stop:12877 length:417 start_codon:yes stop_codon:yes gene_type:complete